MNNEQLAMSSEKKTCLDCLHCKVCAKSKGNCKLCFCAVSTKAHRHKENYWQKRKVCKKFDDMTIVEPVRRPLLRKRA